jgi:hypothetical protein
MRSGLDGEAMRIFVSVSLGTAITRFSTLFPTPLSYPQVDVALFGAPVTWITEVLLTGDKVINWIGFTIDSGFWSIISYIALVALIHLEGAINKWRRQFERHNVRPPTPAISEIDGSSPMHFPE